MSGQVGSSNASAVFKEHFQNAYYEVRLTDEQGETTDWHCPIASQEKDSLDNRPDWRYCPMFNIIDFSDPYHTDPDTPRKVTIGGTFVVVVPGTDINLFDEEVDVRIRVPTGCADISCIDRPNPGDNEPQDFVNRNTGATEEEG